MGESLQVFLKNCRFSELFWNFGPVGSWYMDKRRSPLDRARWVLSMGIIYRFWSGLWTNHARHFKKYMMFSSFFCSIWDFSPVCKGAGEKINSALDRARRTLSMNVIHRFWSGLWANPYRFSLVTVGFQEFFAILEWLWAVMWTKNDSIW